MISASQHTPPRENQSRNEISRFHDEAKKAVAEKRYAAAALLYERCLHEHPDAVTLLCEFGSVLASLNRLADAVHTYRLALANNPGHAESLLMLSYLLMRMKSHAESFHFARHFLRLVDDVAFGYYLAGYTAREIGRWQDSRRYLLRAVELDPSHVYARVLCCMAVFTVCMDVAEAHSILNSYAVELDQLIRETRLDTVGQIDSAVDGIGALAPFFLPYLGCDVTALQAKYGGWVCAVMAAKYPQFAQPLPKQTASGKIKIGIISHYFHEHSHWKIALKGWLEQLDRNRFALHSVHTGDIRDEITEYASSISDSFLQSSDIDALIAAIRAQNPDVLLYSGIGMDTVTMKLAGLRLAPVQCTSWGHPLTTGMPTVDYFLSSELMEPPDGARQYTEQLIRLPNLSIYCQPAEPLGATAAKFAIPGARQDDIVFLCCQNLLKYLPQYDYVFPGIARKAENARFVFIECHVAELTERFKRRLQLAFANYGLTAADYITFVPPLNGSDYAALNARSDVFLDSIGWSGGNTTLESLPYNKPIVTFPGSFMRGRHTYAILKMMGLNEMIAATVEEYIAIAVRLANDRPWRDEISAKICRNKQKIYQDDECIKSMERFLVQVSGREPCEA